MAFTSLSCFVVLGSYRLRDVSAEEPPLEVSVLLDDSYLRFPEPIYGFLQVRNSSGESQYMPSLSVRHGAFGGELLLTAGSGKQLTEYYPMDVPDIPRQPPGYASTKCFLISVEDHDVVTAICSNRTGEITFTVYTWLAQPSSSFEIPTENEKVETEVTGISITSKPAEFRYSLGRTIFKPHVDSEFSVQAHQPKNWRTIAKMMERYRRAYRKNPERPRVDFEFRDIDRNTTMRLPILHVFSDKIERIQSAVRCDTATWRALEIRRLLMSRLMIRQTPEVEARLIEDLMDVLRCCGLAESYSNAVWITGHLLSNHHSYADEPGRPGFRLSQQWGKRLAEEFLWLSFFGQ